MLGGTFGVAAMAVLVAGGDGMRKNDPAETRFYEEMGRRLLELRLRADMSQDDLSEASGITQAAISLIERGEKRIECYTAAKLARSLGVAPGELVGKAVEK